MLKKYEACKINENRRSDWAREAVERLKSHPEMQEWWVRSGDGLVFAHREGDRVVVYDCTIDRVGKFPIEGSDGTSASG